MNISIEDLKEYLKMMLDIEQNIECRKQLINKLNCESQSLCVRQDILKNQPSSAPIQPAPPQRPNGSLKKEKILFTIFLIITIIVVLFLLASLGTFLLAMFTDYVSVSEGANAVFAIIGASVVLFFSIALLSQKKNDKDELETSWELYWQEIKEQETRYSAEKNEYESRVMAAETEYQARLKAEEKRLVEESIRKDYLERIISLEQAELREAENRRQKAYAIGFIFPKYQYLEAVAQIYEYFLSGRCKTLENESSGIDGAYNLFELELRLNRIVTGINNILASLETIKNNQYILYQTCSEMNNKISSLAYSTRRLADTIIQNSMYTNMKLDSLAASSSQLAASVEKAVSSNQDMIEHMIKSSEIGAYNTEQTQKEIQYLNRMNYLSGKYDNVFYNMPPNG